MTTFTDEQYQAVSEEMRISAQAGVPILLRYLTTHAQDDRSLYYEDWRPNRVLDVGCGPGWWAREFFDRYCTETLGVDGPAGGQAIRDRDCWPCRYAEADLTRPLTEVRGITPSVLPTRWDLALCLEVAEHLQPEDGLALVDRITELAPVVVFSAAIPGQGGIGHVNEQWPQYWADRFIDRGWRVSGDIRWKLWAEGLAPYYAQNMFIAWEPDKLRVYPQRPDVVPGVVHPGVWSHVTGRG